jgi:hypothetical protein
LGVSAVKGFTLIVKKFQKVTYFHPKFGAQVWVWCEKEQKPVRKND